MVWYRRKCKNYYRIDNKRILMWYLGLWHRVATCHGVLPPEICIISVVDRQGYFLRWLLGPVQCPGQTVRGHWLDLWTNQPQHSHPRSSQCRGRREKVSQRNICNVRPSPAQPETTEWNISLITATSYLPSYNKEGKKQRMIWPAPIEQLSCL